MLKFEVGQTVLNTSTLWPDLFNKPCVIIQKLDNIGFYVCDFPSEKLYNYFIRETSLKAVDKIKLFDGRSGYKLK